MIEKIVSGGQTGVDRAALDAALAVGFPCGGWCPRGRRAEDGVLPERYPLTETDADDPADRTRRNVRDADGTLVLAPGARADAVPDGTATTVEAARLLGKPLLILDPVAASADTVLDWVRANGVRVLNVAGPRASTVPGLYAPARALIEAVVRRAGAAPVRSVRDA